MLATTNHRKAQSQAKAYLHCTFCAHESFTQLMFSEIGVLSAGGKTWPTYSNFYSSFTVDSVDLGEQR